MQALRCSAVSSCENAASEGGDQDGAEHLYSAFRFSVDHVLQGNPVASHLFGKIG
jgi:hypothetical protein